MVEALEKLVERFPGEAARVRCFTHVINLVAKSIIRQFDVPKNLKKDIIDEALAELRVLADDLEREEEETKRGSGTAEGDEEGDDKNTEGWVDEREEMTDEEIAKLEADVKPTCLVLLKVKNRLLIVM